MKVIYLVAAFALGMVGAIGLSALCVNKPLMHDSDHSFESDKSFNDDYEVKYKTQQRYESDFRKLTGIWRSTDETVHFEVKIDGRLVTIKSPTIWGDLNGVTFLLGMPQADFFHGKHLYLFAYSIDPKTDKITSLSLLRDIYPGGNEDYEEVKLEGL